jgi:hypothetical protein
MVVRSYGRMEMGKDDQRMTLGCSNNQEMGAEVAKLGVGHSARSAPRQHALVCMEIYSDRLRSHNPALCYLVFDGQSSCRRGQHTHLIFMLELPIENELKRLLRRWRPTAEYLATAWALTTALVCKKPNGGAKPQLSAK